MYTIKTVTSLTGLSSETLRAWERRYATVTPTRDDKGRRVYSQHDIERLNLLRLATSQGFSIGKIASLNNQELQQLFNNQTKEHTTTQDQFQLKIIDALMQYRIDLCEELLKRALIASDPLSYAEQIVLPTLQKIGDLWHEGKISIAQEHMFSFTVKRIILSTINNVSIFSNNNPSILFATLEEEHHEFGILLTSLLSAYQRFSVYYLGTNLPWSELIIANEKLQPSIILLSSINTPPKKEAIKSLINLTNALPKSTKLWIGGAGADYLFTHTILPNQYHYICNLSDFNNQIKTFMTQSNRR